MVDFFKTKWCGAFKVKRALNRTNEPFFLGPNMFSYIPSFSHHRKLTRSFYIRICAYVNIKICFKQIL